MIAQVGFAQKKQQKQQQLMMTPPVDDQELNFNSKSILPAPSEAAAINKGGDVSVNLSVGAPTVMIPIANVASRFISFPVSLNYSSNGIRVNELASNTGLGWSLNCGGAVTRTTLGLPDEERSQYNNGVNNFNKPYLDPTERATITYLRCGCSGKQGPQKHK
ncbi:hypothetical protein GFS24_06905 [Chitinophaga sp. SYP-B3965]|uniref:hypothetical protein n=1 Tax=Chitinophaga sp. SYP-B3965 TaxID=2663120 RepID=UPI001299863B|nr:hypothetical protein [Chitinophaga sp. SYP-B3965]MRG44836.1 hypothetical protein [Chitinophaga sp. SYP-B3965]